MNFIINNTEENISFSGGYKNLQQEGLLMYEYNPLKVFRINKDVKEGEKTIIPKNSIINLDTELLDFDLSHPVDIIPQYSYDGSVNLILNDGVRPPRLINSRFSATSSNTYQIVDREGDNDSNIYDEDTFESDISLYKKTTCIPKLKFLGLSGNGNLKVGNYTFYFKFSDSDGNETDFVAESSTVSCFIGNINQPNTIRGGMEDENSYKAINFELTNIDASYSHVTVYFVRSTSDASGISNPEAFRVVKKYPIIGKTAQIVITGYEVFLEQTLDSLNIQYSLIENAKAQTTCQNMLFFGNVANININYDELSDLSLRITPELCTTETIGKLNYDYSDETGGYEYYNPLNIYNKLGYWNKEIYRFGVVYILKDYTLSPVFNIRGIEHLDLTTKFKDYPVLNEDKQRNYIPVNNYTNKLEGKGNYIENSKGVVRIFYNDNQFKDNGTIPLGFNFNIPSEALSELKKHTLGCFIVRQKRMMTTLAQAALIGLDKCSNLPVLPIEYSKSNSNIGFLHERFINNEKILTHDFESRKYIIDGEINSEVISGGAAICPEYTVNQPFLNNYFVGSDLLIEPTTSNLKNGGKFNRKTRMLFPEGYDTKESNNSHLVNIISVSENVKATKGKTRFFSSRAGEMEEVDNIAYCGYKNKNTDSVNIVRGIYSPYLGVESLENLELGLYNIKIPGFDESLMYSYFDIRYNDHSPYSAVCDRLAWSDLTHKDGIYKIEKVFRGDCFICNYTQRMIRNFQDSEAPTIDEIVDTETWKENYSVGENESAEKRTKINRGDVNAVKLGHWVTFKVCSNINLSLRSIDPYYPSEAGLTGKMRGFYPYNNMDYSGEGKIPESYLHNGGYQKVLSERIYFEEPNVPAVKNKFGTRIMYSDIAINDAFKNGFRVFRSSRNRDYPMTYGQITKLIDWGGNIICIFEHGVACIPVNERAVAAQGTGGSAYINTYNVLPDNPNIISDTFGSQWAESVIKTQNAIYGVDTVAKKLWVIKKVGYATFGLEVISDLAVQRFLNENITLDKHETTPIIGVRNVKTHYNAYKGDVMFTFYDDLNNSEERAWNLCYNEKIEKYITFYSWIPSYSQNINNIYFSFDRNVSKKVAKLYSSTFENIEFIPEEGVMVKNSDRIISLNKSGVLNIGTLKIKNIEEYLIKTPSTEIKDNLRNLPIISFEVIDYKPNSPIKLINDSETNTCSVEIDLSKSQTEYTLKVKATVTYPSLDSQQAGGMQQEYSSILNFVKESYLDNTGGTKFWKHGLAGLAKTNEPIKPTFWYGKQHPFEFEFIIAEQPNKHKIFTELRLIANKAEPESLHFEIDGEVYNFADDKENMYFRQEALKHIYRYNGADILYDRDYLNIEPKQRSVPFSSLKDKSTMFPLYVSRVDTINEIEDYYQRKNDINKDYQRLSGSEIVLDKVTNTYKIATHIKACPFNSYYKQPIDQNRYNKYHSSYPYQFIEENGQYYEIKSYGRLNGNIHYKEGNWNMQIPSINYWQKNEADWLGKTPINVSNNPLPEDMPVITGRFEDIIPLDLQNKISIDSSKWTARKETRIQGKYLKIRVRYSGKDLAIVNGLVTVFINSNSI